MKIDKDKFRLLGTEDSNYQIDGGTQSQLNAPTVTIVKLLIEVVDDQESILAVNLIL